MSIFIYSLLCAIGISCSVELSTLIKANQPNLSYSNPHIVTVFILIKSSQFKDLHGSSRFTYLYIFVTLCHSGNSLEMETNPGSNSMDFSICLDTMNLE